MTTTIGRNLDPQERSHRRRKSMGLLGMPLLILLLVVVFSLLRPNSFGTWQNATTILVEQSVLIVLALSVMIPLVVGEFDLSVASMMGIAAMLTIGLPTMQGLPDWLTVLVVLAAAVVVGLVHSLLIVRFGLPSFVVTLGSNTLLGGLILLYSDGAVIYATLPPSFTAIGSGKFLGIGLPVWGVALLVAILWFFLEKRPIGRMMYAVGANEHAARLAGVRTQRVKTLALTLAPVVAALAGILLTSRVGSASPTSFQSFFLPAFAAAFLSLAAIRVGRYNPIGVAVSVLLLAVGVSGLMSLGVPSWVEPVFNGVALVVAIALAKFTAGRGVRLTPSA